jgi:hypothetical protein
MKDLFKGVKYVLQTCANRWYNKQYEAAQIYYMNGLCYEIPLDFNRNNIKKIPGLVGLDKQTMTDPRTNITKLNYGMGALGSSVHYSSKVRSRKNHVQHLFPLS